MHLWPPVTQLAHFKHVSGNRNCSASYAPPVWPICLVWYFHCVSWESMALQLWIYLMKNQILLYFIVYVTLFYEILIFQLQFFRSFLTVNKLVLQVKYAMRPPVNQHRGSDLTSTFCGQSHEILVGIVAYNICNLIFIFYWSLKYLSVTTPWVWGNRMPSNRYSWSVIQ